jgi:hypothetical protein
MSEVIQLGTNRRSALMEAILKRQKANPIHSGTQLGIEMLAMGIDAWSQNKLLEQEELEEERLEQEQVSGYQSLATSLLGSRGALNPLELGQVPSVENLEQLKANQRQIATTNPFLSAMEDTTDPVLLELLAQEGISNVGGQVTADRERIAKIKQDEIELGITMAKEERDEDVAQRKATTAFARRDDRSPALRSMDEYNDAVETFGVDHPQTKIMFAALKKSVTRADTTMSMIVQPDGTVMFGQGVEGLALQTGGLRDKAKQRQLYFSTQSNLIGEVITGLQETRSRAGLAGSFRKTLQEGIGISADLARLMPGVAEVMQGTIDLVGDIVEAGGGDADVLELFDPQLATTELLENVIAVAIARSKNPEGRLLKSEIANSKIKITGFESAAKVIANLSKARSIIDQVVVNEETLINNLSTTTETLEMQDAELKAALRELVIQYRGGP